jgi:hypothetical protein
MKNPNAQNIQLKYVLNENETEIFHYYEESKDEFVYCFFGDLEIDGDLRLDWEGYGDAGNYAEGFCKRYNVRGGWRVDHYNTITMDGKEVDSPLKTIGIVPGDTIHSINGYPLPANDTDVIFAGSPEQVEIEYTHLGEAIKTTFEPLYVDGKGRVGINLYELEDGVDFQDYGIVVLGNLKVNGSVVNKTGEGGPMLYVKGNLEADNLIAGGAYIEVKGTTTVKHYVYGHYNDGIARLDDIVAKAVFNSDHDMSIGKFDGPYIDDFDIEEYFDDKYEDEIEAMLAGADIIKPIEDE